MSEFYGRTRGGRSEGTRCGTSGSGIRSTVETWRSIVRTAFRMEGDGHMASVEITDKSGNGTGFRFDIDADGLARFRRGDGVNGEYGGDDVETTAHLDEVREEITSTLAAVRTHIDQLNQLLAVEASL